MLTPLAQQTFDEVTKRLTETRIDPRRKIRRLSDAEYEDLLAEVSKFIRREQMTLVLPETSKET